MRSSFKQGLKGVPRTQVGNKGVQLLVRRGGLFHLSKGKEKAGIAMETSDKSNGRKLRRFSCQLPFSLNVVREGLSEQEAVVGSEMP